MKIGVHAYAVDVGMTELVQGGSRGRAYRGGGLLFTPINQSFA